MFNQMLGTYKEINKEIVSYSSNTVVSFQQNREDAEEIN